MGFMNVLMSVSLILVPILEFFLLYLSLTTNRMKLGDTVYMAALAALPTWETAG